MSGASSSGVDVFELGDEHEQVVFCNDRASGLRAIIEEVLLYVMYDVPSRGDIAKVIVTREVVEDGVAPTLVPREAEGRKRKSA